MTDGGYRPDAVLPAHLLASLFLVSLLLYAGFGFAALDAPITLAVSPRVSLAPATWAIRIRVPRHAANREIRLETNGPDYRRVSQFPLEGADARTWYELEWRGVPEGTYTVQATVWSATGMRGAARQAVIVR